MLTWTREYTQVSLMVLIDGKGNKCEGRLLLDSGIKPKETLHKAKTKSTNIIFAGTHLRLTDKIWAQFRLDLMLFVIPMDVTIRYSFGF